ncbi:MAG: triose-phosphate isomerase [bacterium]
MSIKKDRVVIANWKMKLGLAESVALAKSYGEVFKDFKGSVVACPGAFALSQVAKTLKGSPIKVGAQNVFWEDKGAYTGEIPASVLTEIGCEYVIIGHSERRQYLLENYEMIHQKIKTVLNTKQLIPVVCIGENMEERKTDRRDFVLAHQLQQALGGINFLSGQQIIIAYEPIWAIGSGTAIEPSEAEYAHRVIKQTIKDIFGLPDIMSHFKIIYGGSVSSKIVKDFVGLEDIDGLLVGGASLDANEFYKVAKAMLK